MISRERRNIIKSCACNWTDFIKRGAGAEILKRDRRSSLRTPKNKVQRGILGVSCEDHIHCKGDLNLHNRIKYLYDCDKRNGDE